MWHARLHIAQAEFTRMQALRTDGVVSQQQFDTAESARKSAQAQWRASQQRLTQAQAEVERGLICKPASMGWSAIAPAQLKPRRCWLALRRIVRQWRLSTPRCRQRALLQQAQADLDAARLQLSYTTLRTPWRARIARKHLEVGQVVQVGRPVLAVVPLHHVWVEAEF